MSAVEVIIANVFRQYAPQVAFIERNHVIHQFSPAASDPTFRDAILPRAAERGSDRLQSDCFDGAADVFSELAVPIMKQESVPVIIRERLAELLRDPEAGWVPRDIAVQDAPSSDGFFLTVHSARGLAPALLNIASMTPTPLSPLTFSPPPRPSPFPR